LFENGKRYSKWILFWSIGALYSTDWGFVILQLLRIEEELGDKAVYAGLKFRKPAEPY
jgi:hypothetical protein